MGLKAVSWAGKCQGARGTRIYGLIELLFYYTLWACSIYFYGTHRGGKTEHLLFEWLGIFPRDD